MNSVRPRKSLTNPQLTRPARLTEGVRDPKFLWLDKNENLDAIYHEQILTMMREISLVHAWTYPDLGPLYKKLATLDQVNPEQLLLTAGSDGVIRAVFEAYVSEGDVVVHTQPTFAMYPVYCQIFGARALAQEYLKRESADAEPKLDWQALLETIRSQKPKLVCLPNPDSPTGSHLESRVIRELIDLCAQQGTLCLIDEAYFPFVSDTAAGLCAQFPNVVVARTFSKAWGLAGLRIGYAIASPEVAAQLHKVRPMYEISTWAAAVIDAALDHRDWMQASVARINEGKAHFQKAMRELGFATFKTQGNFCHVDFGSKREAIWRELDAFVLYRKKFSDRSLEGVSRLTMAPIQVLEPVITAIKKGASK